MSGFEDVMEKWTPVAGKLYNAEYEKSGPDKHDIEEMRTDIEYETCCVECAINAFRMFSMDNDYFDRLEPEQKILIIKAALDSEDAQYGWYRGNLPEIKVIKAALKEL